jgi:hypothetical protein
MDLFRNTRRASKKHGAWNHELKNLKKDRGFCGKVWNAAYSRILVGER